jgi:two-component system CheB/CheR fusion protein
MDFDPLEAARTVQRETRPRSMELNAHDGTVYLIRVLPYHIGPEAYSGTIFTFVDVTELTRTRRDLEKSRQVARDIVRHMPAGLFIYVLDENGRLVLESGNTKARDLTGIDGEAMKGTPFETLWPNASGTGLKALLLKVMDTGETRVLEDFAYADPNLNGHYRITAFSIPEKRLAVLFEDLTAHRRLKSRLATAELKHDKLFETISQGVVYQDGRGRIISANPAAERILGLTLDQMMGKTSMDPDWKVIRQDGSDLPGEEHPSMRALRTAETVRGFVMGVYNPALGGHRWIRVDAIPERAEGGDAPFQVFTVFEDVTDTWRPVSGPGTGDSGHG